MELITIRNKDGLLLAAVPKREGVVGPGALVATIMASTKDLGVRYLTIEEGNLLEVDVPNVSPTT